MKCSEIDVEKTIDFSNGLVHRKDTRTEHKPCRCELCENEESWSEVKQLIPGVMEQLQQSKQDKDFITILQQILFTFRGFRCDRNIIV